MKTEKTNQDPDPVGALTTMVRLLVDYPDEVRVEEERGRDTSLLLIHCHPDDRRMVIGKQGNCVQALRTILGRVAAKDGRRVCIEVANSKPNSALTPRAERELRRIAS